MKKGFTPETDNTMEQIFSLIGDVADKARSFKTDSGLTNFCYNLFVYYYGSAEGHEYPDLYKLSDNYY